MKKVSLILIATMGTIMSLTSYKVDSNEVTIGKQVWMAENLNVVKFRNGDPIPEAKTNEEWKKAGENKQPAWCYYDNDSANGTKYGKLYNWYAVNDPRRLAPAGWKIASDQDWTVLTDYLGGEHDAGEKIKSTSGWEDNGNGTNSSGFSGLPGGYRNYAGPFTNFSYGNWWSSSNELSTNAWYFYLNSNDSNIKKSNYYKTFGFSVRCIKDKK
jgi:uncharacterized protein (TIGR02145 family)